MIEDKNIGAMGFQTPASVQLMAEAERRAFADRAEYMGDGDFYKLPEKTLNNSDGSKTVVAGAGFLLNDEMDDFSAKPGVPNLYGAVGGEANAISPGKRMLSSMTPTVVLKNDKPYLV